MFCDMTAVKYQCREGGILAQSSTRDLKIKQKPFCFCRVLFGRLLFIKMTLLSRRGTINPPQALSITASLSLSSFVRNADKLSIHTKCSSHPIGCSVPMWLLLANNSSGTFGAVWGWSVAPLHHCSNRLPWQRTRPLPYCFSVCVCVWGTWLYVYLSVCWMCTDTGFPQAWEISESLWI